jgi:hypothetical protein
LKLWMISSIFVALPAHEKASGRGAAIRRWQG